MRSSFRREGKNHVAWLSEATAVASNTVSPYRTVRRRRKTGNSAGLERHLTPGNFEI